MKCEVGVVGSDWEAQTAGVGKGRSSIQESHRKSSKQVIRSHSWTESFEAIEKWRCCKYARRKPIGSHLSGFRLVALLHELEGYGVWGVWLVSGVVEVHVRSLTDTMTWESRWELEVQSAFTSWAVW